MFIVSGKDEDIAFNMDFVQSVTKDRNVFLFRFKDGATSFACSEKYKNVTVQELLLAIELVNRRLSGFVAKTLDEILDYKKEFDETDKKTFGYEYRAKNASSLEKVE